MKLIEITFKSGAKIKVDVVDDWSFKPADPASFYWGHPTEGTRWLREVALDEIASIVELR